MKLLKNFHLLLITKNCTSEIGHISLDYSTQLNIHFAIISRVIPRYTQSVTCSPRNNTLFDFGHDSRAECVSGIFKSDSLRRAVCDGPFHRFVHFHRSAKCEDLAVVLTPLQDDIVFRRCRVVHVYYTMVRDVPRIAFPCCDHV